MNVDGSAKHFRTSDGKATPTRRSLTIWNSPALRRVKSVKTLSEVCFMTIRKLLLTLSIILSCGLIIGGIVVAQEAPKAPEAAKSPKAPKAPKVEWTFDDDAFDFDFDFDVPEVWAPQGDR